MNYLHEHKEYIGVAGTIIGVISFRALLYKIYTTGITVNFPYESLILTLIGWALTFFYGFISKSISIMLLGSIYFFMFLSILIVKILNPDKS